MPSTRPTAALSWFGRTPDHFAAARGHAEVRRQKDGWFMRVDQRWAGPFSNLDAAMDRAGELLADAERSAAA